METILAMGCFLFAAVCAIVYMLPWKEKPPVKRFKKRDRQAEREAHYMRNFWYYDGSEQEEYEE